MRQNCNLKGRHWGLVVGTLKQKIFEKIIFLLSTCVGHSSLFCGTLICLLMVGNLIKTCNVYVDLVKALKRFPLFNRCIPILNRNCKAMEDILRYLKICFQWSPFNVRNEFMLCLNKVVMSSKPFLDNSWKFCHVRVRV